MSGSRRSAASPRDIAAQAKDLNELHALAAEKIDRPKDREAFLAVCSRNTGVGGTPARLQFSSADLGGSRDELTAEAIERATRLLVRYVGPLAGVLTKRAAQQASGLRSLYGILARHIDTEDERKRFLQEAGFRGE